MNVKETVLTKNWSPQTQLDVWRYDKRTYRGMQQTDRCETYLEKIIYVSVLVIRIVYSYSVTFIPLKDLF